MHRILFVQNLILWYMSEIYGYNGKILWVNLTDGTIQEEEPGEEVYKKYLGGYGLGVYYIYKRMKADADPLGPDNILGFCPGLLTGSPAPFTGRYMVCGKSPLTGGGRRSNGEKSSGGWGDANSGGFFGPAIKRAGFDAIFFEGAAEKPVYLLIKDGKKELVDASEIWGKDAVQADEMLKDKHGKLAKVASIGVAAENKVLYSGIVNDGGRIAARSGLGAVMGSKNLKAVCIRSRKRLNYADAKKAIELSKEYREQLGGYLDNKLIDWVLPHAGKFTGLLRGLKLPLSTVRFMPKMGHAMFAQFLKKWGTTYFTDLCSDVGDSPIKNYKGTHKDYPKSDVKEVHFTKIEPYKEKSFGCFSCPVQCGAIMKVPELGLEETHRPEYETIMAFGGLILANDLNVIFELNEYLNREGVDTISAGGTVAYAYECAENGLLKKEDFKCEEYPEGFLLEWGDSQYIMTLLRMIVHREGIGDILADGTKRAAEKIPGSREFAVQANGQELPLHDARQYRDLGLSFTVDPTPGRHTSGSNEFQSFGAGEDFIDGLELKLSKDPKKLGRYNINSSILQAWFNALGFCLFSLWCGRYPVLEMMTAILDWEYSQEDLREAGYRIQVLRQMFNAREGGIRHEINRRAIGDPPQDSGPNKDRSLDIETMAQSFYDAMGYDETGVPLRETLERLDLEYCIKDLDIATGRPEPFVNNHLQSK